MNCILKKCALYWATNLHIAQGLQQPKAEEIAQVGSVFCDLINECIDLLSLSCTVKLLLKGTNANEAHQTLPPKFEDIIQK